MLYFAIVSLCMANWCVEARSVDGYADPLSCYEQVSRARALFEVVAPGVKLLNDRCDMMNVTAESKLADAANDLGMRIAPVPRNKPRKP